MNYPIQKISEVTGGRLNLLVPESAVIDDVVTDHRKVVHVETSLFFAIKGERVSVGRRADNSIQINHGTVSGHHGEFVAVNGHYVFRDLESTNHTFVNGFQIGDADLTTTCRLTIGSFPTR